MLGRAFRDRVKRILRTLFEGWMNNVLYNHSRNITRELLRRGLTQTADYIEQHMWELPCPKSHNEMIRYCLSECRVDGIALEFGVMSGSTIREIARNTDGRVYGFDSFEGLPENWIGPEMGVGTFKIAGPPKNLPENVQLVIGLFDESLPAFMDRVKDPIQFVHFDADLYSSTKTALKYISPSLQPGTIFLFDEYYNYPNWKNDGEFRAFQEFVKEKGVEYEYIAHMRGAARRVGVRILSVEVQN